MMDRYPYPIVCHRELRPRWRRSARLERRHPLIAGRDEVLVHNVEGAYTTETADLTRRTAVTVVRVHPDLVSAHWELRVSGDCSFSVAVTFRCTVVDPAAVARSRSTGAPWDVRYVLAQDPRPQQLLRLQWKHPVSEGDADRLCLALTALLQAEPCHQEIAGVRVEFVQVSVELVEVSVERRYGPDDYTEA